LLARSDEARSEASLAGQQAIRAAVYQRDRDAEHQFRIAQEAARNRADALYRAALRAPREC
jgi:hypothetical protein